MDQKEIVNDELVQVSNSKIVKVRQSVLEGFPLLSLRERDLIIREPYVFGSMIYHRPLGAAKMGAAEVELFSPVGKFVSEKLYFEFAFSERERVVNAHRPESFFLKAGVDTSKGVDQLTYKDFTNKYQDIIIEAMALERSADGRDVARLSYRLNKYFHPQEMQKSYQVTIPINLKPEEVETFSLTETIQVNVLQSLTQTIEAKEKSLEELENFTVNPDFYKASPPVTVDSSAIIPKPYIELIKIDYIPPRDVDGVEAQFLVDYKLNGRLHSERVNFRFAMSIREEAEMLIKRESIVLYKYVPTVRLIPPVFMDRFDFTYNGKLPIEIVGVEYNPQNIDPDSRLVEIVLLIRYRTAIVKIAKLLEFQYSLNEYSEQGEVRARIENKSIIFGEKISDMNGFYELLARFQHETFSNKKFDLLVNKESQEFYDSISDLKVDAFADKLNEYLRKHSKVAAGYPYELIKKVKLVNFDPDSRVAMFKVTVDERFADRVFQRSFEKHMKFQYSYYEWLLDKIHPDNVTVNHKYLPEYPSHELPERIFDRSNKYKIVSYQYSYPGPDKNEALIQMEVENGDRTKLLEKKLVFPYSYNSYHATHKRVEIDEARHSIKPSDLTIVIDTRQKAPKRILPEQVLGVPKGMEVKVIYTPPKPGEKSTRLVLELYKGDFIAGFEQTLVFDVAS